MQKPLKNSETFEETKIIVIKKMIQVSFIIVSFLP